MGKFKDEYNDALIAEFVVCVRKLLLHPESRWHRDQKVKGVQRP